MQNQTPSERKQYWLNHLHAWQQSGLTQAAYCQTHQLKKKNFWYWKRKLITTIEPDVESTHFVQLPSPLASHATTSEGLTIALPNGIHIENIHTGNLFLLKDVMSILK